MSPNLIVHDRKLTFLREVGGCTEFCTPFTCDINPTMIVGNQMFHWTRTSGLDCQFTVVLDIKPMQHTNSCLWFVQTANVLTCDAGCTGSGTHPVGGLNDVGHRLECLGGLWTVTLFYGLRFCSIDCLPGSCIIGPGCSVFVVYQLPQVGATCNPHGTYSFVSMSLAGCDAPGEQVDLLDPGVVELVP